MLRHYIGVCRRNQGFGAKNLHSAENFGFRRHSNVLAAQPAFRVQSRLTAGSRAGNRLTVGMVFYVARRPYAFDIGCADIVRRAAFGFQVICFVHFQLTFENIGIRLVPDGDKMPLTAICCSEPSLFFNNAPFTP